MPYLSSPVAYPLTSSPIYEPHDSPRKRRKTQDEREPLDSVNANTATKARAGFLFDDSDEEDGEVDRGVKPRHNKKPQAQDEDPHAGQPEETQDNERNTMDTTMHNEARDASSQGQNDSGVDIGLTSSLFGARKTYTARTCNGKAVNIRQRPQRNNVHYQKMAAARSEVTNNRAQKEFYGVDIHRLMEQAKAEEALKKVQAESAAQSEKENANVLASTESPDIALTKGNAKQLWTEKYRAKRFTDLVGDERTHRSVLRWLKSWDQIVFPHVPRPKLSKKTRLAQEEDGQKQPMRKVLLLAGPPGLGKTTLAHVCARQAGYEVQEINASDERSRDVVKGRIRDMVCTESVKAVGSATNGKTPRPVCVVVDEVDGVVGGGGGGGGGEGGFIKALIDLLNLDQKNTKALATKKTFAETHSKKKKGDTFRLLRPLILICNDLYHPSLRLLRQGNMAEIVYIRKSALNMIIPRMQSIFEKEGLPCDSDGVRLLCEATWGISNRREERSAGGTGEGDMRGILVVGEWVAAKFKAEHEKVANEVHPARLSKSWLQENVLGELTQGGGAARGLGRGGSKEVVERVFAHNGGFPIGSASSKTLHDALAAKGGVDGMKQQVMQKLHELVYSSGEDDRIMTDCFTNYPTAPYQDDPLLTKLTTGYDWLAFHDTLNTLVYSSTQEWELASYLSAPILAFHHLFSANSRHSAANYGSGPIANDDSTTDIPSHAFTGPRAPITAAELTRTNMASLKDLQNNLSIPLHRSFRSPEVLATDLLPNLLRILNPDIKPVLITSSGSGSGIAGSSSSSSTTASVRRAPEKARVDRAVEAMIACGVRFDRGRVEDVLDAAGSGGTMSSGSMNAGWVYRMQPALDAMVVFETGNIKSIAGAAAGEKVRYAVRQVLEQEHAKELMRKEQESANARMTKAIGATTAAGETHGRCAADEEERDLKKVIEKASVGVQKSSSTTTAVKRDFFGRPIVVAVPDVDDSRDGADGAEFSGLGQKRRKKEAAGYGEAEGRIWISYHEGFSNAVKKPITMKELMDGM